MTDRTRQREAYLLFERALEEVPSEREAWLEHACAGDTDLATAVFALLAADERSVSTDFTGHFLQDTSLSTPPPERVGPYRITGTIGSGGMGVVYRAERDDGTFARTVAIKFIHHLGVGKDVVARFNAERRILANMQHPNIAQMIDGGDVDGRPYLVMDFVEGEPFGHDAQVSRAEQLARFCRVCETISYAHSKLVLHRDIKPTNVLITTDGEPKLLDFGVAKMMDLGAQEADLTGVTGMPITPNYSPPEYLAGEVASVSGEIYSLGVLLHEVVHGRTPHDIRKMSLPQGYRHILEGKDGQEKSDNSDLDLILSTALHVDPDRRYPSVDALRADVENLLANRPISAKGQDIAYSVRKFAQRNKVLVGTVAVSFLLLVGAAIATTSAYLESEQSRLLAEQQTETAEQTIVFLTGALGGANPHSNLGPDATLSDAVEYAETQMEANLTGSPHLRTILEAYIASIFAAQGQIEKGVAYADKVRPKLASPDEHLKRWQIPIYINLIEVYQGASRPEDVIELAARGETLIRNEKIIDWQVLARILNARAIALTTLGRFDEALRSLQEVSRIHDQEYALSPEFMAALQNNIASVYYTQSDLVQAEAHIAAAVGFMEEAGLGDTANGLRARANWATVLGSLKEFDRGEAMFKEVLPKMENLLGGAHQWVLWETANFGRLYQLAGKPDKTVALLEPYLDVIAQHRPEHDEPSAFLMLKLAYGMCSIDRSSKGVELANEGLVTRQLVFPSEHWAIAEAHSLLGMCLMRTGDFDSAEKHLTLGKGLYAKTLGPDAPTAQLTAEWLVELESLKASLGQ